MTALPPFPAPRCRLSVLNAAIAAALAALSATSANAQSAPVKVDKVIVTASPFADQDELQAVQPGVVVGKDALVRDRAASLGDTRSLILHPASTTHRQLTDEQRVAAGAGPEVVRLSVGIETAADLIADLQHALEAATA